MSKVALCFSGLPRGDYMKNIQLWGEIFPQASAFFSTWRGHDLELEHRNFVEPHSNYLAKDLTHLSEEKQALLGRGYKQILGHAYQLNSQVPFDYDWIIRLRYDCTPNPEIDWASYLKETQDKGCVSGFRIWIEDEWDYVKQVHPEGLVLDHVIMHHRDDFDPFKAMELFYCAELQPCEMGWYQMFQEQEIRNYNGGCELHK